METIFIILVAELVNCDLPSLQEMSCPLRDLSIHACFAASINLEDSGNVRILEVLDCDGKRI